MSDISSRDDQVVSLGDWLITLILSGIPLVGFIMILVWAFGGGAKVSKRNYARAVLIVGLIVGAITVVLSILFSATFIAVMSQIGSGSY